MKLRKLDDIYVEVEQSPTERLSERYGLTETGIVDSDKDNLELSIIKRMAWQVETELKQTNASEAEVSFGLKITAEGMIYISNSQEKSNLNIKLKWNREEKG